MTKQKQEKKTFSDKISLAPMLDWTDTHFRTFMRLICHHPVFYTEMIACPAILLGDRKRLLSYNNPIEHPLILQIGGSDPKMMGDCAVFASDYGYQGININAGCPSSRVQSGKFGAVLMKTPDLVADCIAEMRAKSALPVSVKTRIALSDTTGDGFDALFHFADTVVRAGCTHLIVHARKAKLNLSPKDNRNRLTLNYAVVYRLKRSFPDITISINGNVLSLDDAENHLNYVDGVMIGRLAYGNPYALATVDSRFYKDNHPILSRLEILQSFLPYLETHADKLSVICPHLMGLYHGQPNAKTYKQTLSTRDIETIRRFIQSDYRP